MKTSELRFRALLADGTEVLVRPVFYVDVSGSFCDVAWQTVDETVCLSQDDILGVTDPSVCKKTK